MSCVHAVMRVSLLTGGGDPHYASGLSESLVARDVLIDLVGSDEFETPTFRGRQGIRFLNLRGSVDPNVGGGEREFVRPINPNADTAKRRDAAITGF